jgi:1-acyl-sn-glycerol-3-phosphate acyltransferase
VGEEVVAPARRPAGPETSALRRAAQLLSDGAYWGMWAVVGTAVRLLFRVRVEGLPLPAGPCVIVANHTSYLDPVLLGAVCRRRITFLMNAIICRTPPLRWFYRWNRVVPIEPAGNNRDALRAARAALGRGAVLGVFPEGGISRDGVLALGNPGAVSLALSGDVPVIPVGIVGAADVLPPHAGWPRLCRVRIRFGAPLSAAALLEDGDAQAHRKHRLQVATRRVMAAIAALSEQESRESILASFSRVPTD